MKVDLKVAGSKYSSVPSILIPLESSRKARFCEVSDTTASAGDVKNGKTFYDADGNYTVGTNTGGNSGTTAEAVPYKITIQQTEHQTLAASFEPLLTDGDALQEYERKNTEHSLELAGKTTRTLNYRLTTTLRADDGWRRGSVKVTGKYRDGILYGDAVITATAAEEDPEDVPAPEGYDVLYLGENKLYMDNELVTELKTKDQVDTSNPLYIRDKTQNSTSLANLFSPDNKNAAGAGLDMHAADLSNIKKDRVTDLGSLFLGCSNLESADLSGFGYIEKIYSLFAYCDKLKVIYMDTLRTRGAETLNTYHTLSTCSNLEYLILDSPEVNFVLQTTGYTSIEEHERGLPYKVKILVPRAALDTYKKDSYWSGVAGRIRPMEDYNIVRKNGTVTVTEKGA